MKRFGVVTLFAGYLSALLLWLADVVGHLFLPLHTASTLGLWGFLGSPVFFVGILVWALWPPRRRAKIGALAIAFVLGMASFHFFSPLRAASDQLYLARHQADLEEFVNEIRDDRIWSITHGQDWYKRLNGTMVAFTEVGRDSVTIGQDRRPMLATILQRDSIELATYRTFADRLRALHYEEFTVYGQVVVFRRDRDTGIAYTPGLREALDPGDGVPGTSRVVSRHITGEWYAWYW